MPLRSLPILLLAIATTACQLESQPDQVVAEAAEPAGLYALDARSLEGAPAPLSRYAGQVCLIVNVASECGYTPQYAGLQDLHERHSGRGFQVLAFPSNEFGGQEPGDAAAIRDFCTQNYGVTFPVFEKCSTKPGDAQSPVYGWLGEQTGSLPGWNFCKYLIDRNGQVVGFYESKTAPDDEEFDALVVETLERDAG